MPPIYQLRALDAVATAPTPVKPPAARPAVPGTIEWRPMVVNWFGSMVMAGLCAPLLVWLTIYCIRTRRIEVKKKAKTAQGTQPTLNIDDPRVQNSVPPITMTLGTDHGNRKVPKRVNLRRWMGWWTSSSQSREYPRDLRARVNGNYTHSKREHFARFWGWWTWSAEESVENTASNRASETESRDRSILDIIHTSFETQSDVENFQMRVMISSPRDWRFRRQSKARMPLNNTAKERHSRSSQEMFHNSEAVDVGLLTHRIQATTSGAKVQQYDGLRDDEIRVETQNKGTTTPTDVLDSEETSGHWTIRRRAVGIAEACDWDNLQSELRKSIHSQMLLPDELSEEKAHARPSDFTQISTNVSQAAGELSPPLRRLLKTARLSPRLRKVCSSPNLHSAFEQISTREDSPERYGTSQPGMLHSISVPILSVFQIQAVGSKTVKGSDPSQALIKVDELPFSALGLETETEDARASSFAFSFDKTRRSALDVVNRPVEEDFRTLNEYEAESSIDTEVYNRDYSGTSFSSIQYDLALNVEHRPTDTNGATPDLKNLEEVKAMPPCEKDSCTGNISFLKSSSGSVPDKDSRSAPTRAANTANAQLLGDLEIMTNRFATVSLPKRRYSFPSIREGIDLKSELDRKFRFRFAHVKEEQSSENNRNGQRLPRHQSKSTSGNQELVITKTRSSKPGKSKDQKAVKSRKLTPFQSWNEQLLSDHQKRNRLPRHWQTLARLSEAPSLLSENDLPVRDYFNADPWCDGPTALDCDNAACFSEHTNVDNLQQRSTMKDITERSNAAGYSQRCVTPEQLSGVSSSLQLMDAGSQSQSLPIWSTRDDAGILRLTPVRVVEKRSPGPSVLTETKPAWKKGPIKRAFTNQSWAEKAKRRESMQRAGRLIGDRNNA